MGLTDRTVVAQDNVAVFHPGTQHSWQTARALQELRRLEWYATSIYYQRDRWPYLLERLPGSIGQRFGREFRRFKVDGLDPDYVRTFGLHEWAERVIERANMPRLAAWFDKRGNLAFGRALEREIASDKPFRLWGYDNSSLTAFAAGRHHGRTCMQLPSSEASLTVVGDVKISEQVFARYRDRITHIPTVARADVPRIMAEHDVLVFPTYFEGAGIVLYEALACGMALIQTDRAAAAVTEDTGIMLPKPDTELLLERCGP